MLPVKWNGIRDASKFTNECYKRANPEDTHLVGQKLGQRRFSKPEPPLKWTGVRDASKFGNECHQRYFPGYEPYKVNDEPVSQSEDCLYLNIYRPSDTKTAQPLAVMVWIHGGGYYIGAGSQYDGSELAATGVIVVTLNYRLDIFGFLSSEDDYLPGNFGMLDQVMALKWVKENIQPFGGDPNKVTVFGESSGGGSVSLLILSPLASGLFHRAIMSTGASLSPWAITTEVTRITPKILLALVGDKVGCRDSDTLRNLQCLRNADARILFNASESVGNAFNSAILFAPRVEREFSFLPDLPINLLTKNKFNHVDTIHGFPTDGFAGEIFNLGVNLTSEKNFVILLKQALEPYALMGRDTLIDNVVESYLGDTTDGDAIRFAVIRAISDFFFDGPILIEADIQSRLAITNKHYVYEFHFKPSFSRLPRWISAVHGEDLPFIFGVNLPEFQIPGQVSTREDNLVWNQMKTMWSNFAKYGNPSETIPIGAASWTPYFTTNSTYLKIDSASQTFDFDRAVSTTMYRKFLQKLQADFNYP